MAISDIISRLPPLPAYPPDSVAKKISATDWQIFLENWISSIELRLRLSTQQFSDTKSSTNVWGTDFILSYLRQYAPRHEPIQAGSREAKLHHLTYLLLKRCLLETNLPHDVSSSTLFTLLADGSVVFFTILDWRSTLKTLWTQKEIQLKLAIEALKSSLMKDRSAESSLTVLRLRQLTALIRLLPEAAVVAVAGSDYLETNIDLYVRATPEVQRALTESWYYGLRSLLSNSANRVSLLLDVMFELKAGAAQAQKADTTHSTLLSSLLCTTPFLKHFQSDTAVANGKRGQTLITSLVEYKNQSSNLHPAVPNDRSRRAKGKGKAKSGPKEEMHVHKASRVSEIHDLFPQLPEGYILELLDHFADNVEDTIAGLLEPSSLPPRLSKPDESDHTNTGVKFDGLEDLAPRSTPELIPQRKNVFDGDNFDTLQISSSLVHRGRKEIEDQPQTNEEKVKSKAAILAALAAFDADDDERDDTYDVGDVGGAVDNSLDSDEKRVNESTDRTEEVLFRAWLANPDLFSRDSKTRLSSARRQLNEDAKMDNEQVEGWAIMLNRDVKLQERLRTKYSTVRMFQGNQNSIASNKWRANDSASESQDENINKSNDGRRVGNAGIRGTRNWNPSRGRGSTAGPPNDHATQMARKRKEQGRGRGGASHRREGRAKKMGRGMGPVSQ